MDELTTRDAANEAKFAGLSRTLEMLVKGETLKTMDGKMQQDTICMDACMHVYYKKRYRI